MTEQHAPLSESEIAAYLELCDGAIPPMVIREPRVPGFARQASLEPRTAEDMEGLIPLFVRQADRDHLLEYLVTAWNGLPRLLADLRRARAALASLVSTRDAGYCSDDDLELATCAYCGGKEDYGELNGRMTVLYLHEPDCPILAARRALGLEVES